jgi:hypothetical protein
MGALPPSSDLGFAAMPIGQNQIVRFCVRKLYGIFVDFLHSLIKMKLS